MSLNERDRMLIWHPFTLGKVPDPVIGIKRASGAYLYDENDKSYLDLTSSWWVNIHGHCHPEIFEAVCKQSKTLDHIIFAGFTHEPAIQLCEILHDLLPKKLCKFLFSDNGSTAVETAIKMCYQYWLNKGYTEKTTFVCFEGGYHGATVGSMSVGIGSGLCGTFRKLLFPVITIPYADTWIGDDKIVDKENQSLEMLENQLKENASKIASLFIEPLVQGVGGMRICRPQFIERITVLTREYGIPVIFDEVFTGFGRTGTVFAFEHTNVVPDVICLSKGLTGGMLPLSLVVTTEQMQDVFLDDDYSKALPHGHSYTANPLSCAVAVASMKILTRAGTLQAIRQINQAQEKGLHYLQEKSNLIEKIRIIGTIAAFRIKDAKIVKKFKEKCLEEGLLIRPLQGNVISLIPPYCITKIEIEETYTTILKVLSTFEGRS